MEVVWVVAENVALAGGEADFLFEAEENGDVLVGVCAVCDEEGNDDDVGGGGEFVPVGDERLLLHVGVGDVGVACVGLADELDLIDDGASGVLVEAGAVTDDDESNLVARNVGGDVGGALEEELRHGRVDADGRAVVVGFAVDYGGGAGEIELAGDDVLGEIALGDEIGDDVDFVGIEEVGSFAEGGLFFPEAAVDFLEEILAADGVGVIEIGIGGVGIFGGTVTDDEEGAVRFGGKRHEGSKEQDDEFAKTKLENLLWREFFCRVVGVSDAPLGFFDSGVGGLTVVRAVQELLPREDVVYLGDTARLPYGSKSPETIRQFAEEDVVFLLSKGVKAIVVACNTATAHALPYLQQKFDTPILGVIEPGVEAALQGENVERVGIIATSGTIRSHAYQHALAQRKTGLMIYGQATPLLVPFIEENWLGHPALRSVLDTYLQPMLEKGIDTLMLSCTHYPLLVPLLREMLPKEVRLVDSATTCALHLKGRLEELGLCAEREEDGKFELFLTDLSEQFEHLARHFLKRAPGRIQRAVW